MIRPEQHAQAASNLLDELRDKAEARVKSYAQRIGRAGNMTEAEVNARCDRELDRLILCAQTVGLDQIATVIATAGEFGHGDSHGD